MNVLVSQKYCILMKFNRQKANTCLHDLTNNLTKKTILILQCVIDSISVHVGNCNPMNTEYA